MTGMVIGVMGKENSQGELVVTDVCLPGFPPPSPLPKKVIYLFIFLDFFFFFLDYYYCFYLFIYFVNFPIPFCFPFLGTQRSCYYGFWLSNWRGRY